MTEFKKMYEEKIFPLSEPAITLTLSPTFIFMSSSSYKTSGANETIFMYSLSRSSLATGPRTRVPIGDLSSFINTQALSSNLM